MPVGYHSTNSEEEQGHDDFEFLRTSVESPRFGRIIAIKRGEAEFLQFNADADAFIHGGFD